MSAESYVQLVSHTTPHKIFVDGLEGWDKDTMTIEEYLAYVAKVSNPAGQTELMTASRLMKYLVNHRHWSPFEMADVTIEINTTRDIGRQILRHRSFSFQEFSQRYAKASLGYQIREPRLQDAKNRQNSIDTTDFELQMWFRLAQDDIIKKAWEVYEQALAKGIAKEQARVVLPEGMIMSRMYMKGSLRSWIHYCQLRMDPATQKEHRLLATDCWKIITEIFPSLSDIVMTAEPK